MTDFLAADAALLDRLPTDDRLRGRRAVVTGSTSGLGEAIARVLASSGAHVVVHGRDAERAERVRSAIERDGGAASVVLADLGAGGEVVRDFARRAGEALGGVDLLVNNAGIFPVGPTEDVPDATLDALLGTNVRVPHQLVGALAPARAEAGGGTVVNISSWMSRVGTPGVALYPATKAALEHLTRAWAAEYGPRGVRVCGVAPGAVATPGNEQAADVIRALGATTPSGRPGRPVDVAWAVRFLASDEADFIHGAVLDVDGGILATRPS